MGKLANMAANALGQNRHAKPCVSPADGALVRGAHFSNQGYARLNDVFVIDDWLQIKLKFKTTSQEGVLLAIGDPDFPERPCLMLELSKGALRLRLRTKSGTGESMVTFEATYDKFEEGAEACDNQWHSVDARVVRTVLMLIVDGKDGETGFKSDAQQKHEGEIKQYVGGIPDESRAEHEELPRLRQRSDDQRLRKVRLQRRLGSFLLQSQDPQCRHLRLPLINGSTKRKRKGAKEGKTEEEEEEEKMMEKKKQKKKKKKKKKKNKKKKKKKNKKWKKKRKKEEKK